MANSYIDYGEKSARLNDTILIAITLLARDEVRAGSLPLEAGDAIKSWPDEALNAPPGLIELDLTGYWLTDDGKSALRSILDLVAGMVDSFGEFVPSDFLNQLANSTAVVFRDIESTLIHSQLEKYQNAILRSFSGSGGQPWPKHKNVTPSTSSTRHPPAL